MRFGFESEKILFDLKDRWVSDSALRILQALEDYEVAYSEGQLKRVTGEFVHSMIEMVSSPSSEVYAVAKDYLFSYELSREVAARTNRTMLPLGSFPVDYTPVMVTKFQYFVKNAILSHSADIGWNLEPHHRLYNAANCAGVHVHAEITTLPEFLTFTRELMDKHNIALAITPLMAFASSPYFNGVHEAKSMRALRYYHGVYSEVPEIGGFPPMVKDSATILRYYMASMKAWETRGIDLGFDPEEIRKMSARSGANWGLVRWNRKWNTIELRCFDSDFVTLDLAKFTITSRALKRFDVNGERLQTRVLDIEVTDHTAKSIDALLASVIPQTWEQSGREVAVLPTMLIHRLIELSIRDGIENPLVHAYLERLIRFARKEISPREMSFVRAILEGMRSGETTADRILKQAKHARVITRETALDLCEWVIQEEKQQYQALIRKAPHEVQPPRDHPFPASSTSHRH